MAVGAVACMPAAGLMVERFGARATLAVVIAISYVALPFTLLAPDALALAGVLCVVGAASGVTDIAMNANGAAVERRYGRPILSSLHGLWSIGGFVAAGTTALAIALGVPAELHLVCASLVLGGVGLAACTQLMPAAPRTDRPAYAARAALAPPARPGADLARGLPRRRRDQRLGPALPAHLARGERRPSGAAGYAVFVGSMAAMRLTGDRLTARFGRVPIVRTGGAVAAAALAAALLLARPEATFIAFVCAGLGLANVFPLVVSAAGRSRSPAPALAIATVSMGGYAGVLIGPPAIGFLADAASLPGGARARRRPLRTRGGTRRSRRRHHREGDDDIPLSGYHSRRTMHYRCEQRFGSGRSGTFDRSAEGCPDDPHRARIHKSRARPRGPGRRGRRRRAQAPARAQRRALPRSDQLERHERLLLRPHERRALLRGHDRDREAQPVRPAPERPAPGQLGALDANRLRGATST